MNFKKLDKYRIKEGPWGTPVETPWGAFFIPLQSNIMKVICAPMDSEWQHVSVSLRNRCPNWEEMSHIKSLFWAESDTVLQFHPKKSEYVNMHPYCLHLWKKRDVDHELPPSLLVGFNLEGVSKQDKKIPG